MRNRPQRSSALTRKAEKARKDRLGYLIIGLSLGVMILLTTLGFTVFAKEKIDPRNGCLKNNRPPKDHTVVLIDETDSLKKDELSYAKSVVFNEYYWLPVGGRLTVRNIVSDADQAEDIVICRVDDGSSSLGIYDNPRMIRQQFDKIAGRRLEELYTALRTAPEQKSSPILEYIVATSERANFGSNVDQRRLVLISDMAQHSDLLSHYRGSRAQTNADSSDELTADMSGIRVRIHYMSRRDLARIQGDGHRRFWQNRLRKMGAEDVAIGHGLLIGEDQSRETWSEQ